VGNTTKASRPLRRERSVSCSSLPLALRSWSARLSRCTSSSADAVDARAPAGTGSDERGTRAVRPDRAKPSPPLHSGVVAVLLVDTRCQPPPRDAPGVGPRRRGGGPCRDTGKNERMFNQSQTLADEAKSAVCTSHGRHIFNPWPRPPSRDRGESTEQKARESADRAGITGREPRHLERLRSSDQLRQL